MLILLPPTAFATRGRDQPRPRHPRGAAVLAILIWTVGLLIGASRAGATPGLARQYKTGCDTCHTVFPQLNPFGKRFLWNNFRVPGKENEAPLAFRGKNPLSPFALQLQATLNHDTSADPETDPRTNEIQWNGAGLLTRRDAFYLHHHIIRNDHPGDTYEAWLQHVFPGRHPLLVRVGQLEQPLAFTPHVQRRTLIQAPYLVYEMPVGLNDFGFNAPARGVTFSGGALRDGLRFALSLNQPRRLLTTEAEATHPQFDNLFGRAQCQFGGKNIIGVFGFRGATEIVADGRRFEDEFTRFGVDFERQTGRWRLYALYLTGHHADPDGTGGSGSLNGGFVGVDHYIHDRYVAYLRFDRAHSRSPLSSRQDQGVTIGITGLVRENWRFGLEYQRRQGDRNVFVLSTHLAL